MPHISPLHHSVISAIAAGEVVERPAIIVKELIENSVDAGATSIVVNIEDGGKKTIEVSDNGTGMDPEDLILAWQRHTTSKIVAVEDLQSLHTYGFRGEALASMANAAKLTIRSRTSTQPHGWQLTISHGDQQKKNNAASATDSLEPIGMPLGTTVIVEELFARLPARRKFLKSAASEFTQILEIVTAAALSQPAIGFLLTHNQKTVLFLQPGQNQEDRFAGIVSQADQYHPVHAQNETSTVQLVAFFGTPQIARRTSPSQHVFINQRSVKVQWLPAWIKTQYGSLLEAKGHPAFTLFFTLPADQVDINIHPRKELAQFLEEDAIRELVHTAVQEFIRDNETAFQDPSSVDYAQNSSATSQVWRVRDSAANSGKESRVASELTHTLGKETSPWKMDDVAAQFQQLDHTYLVCTTPEGVLLIDQHAAHERILFEQFRQEYQTKISSLEQTVLKPLITFELGALEASQLRENLETFQRMGFELHDFGERQFHLTAVPAALEDRNPQKLILEVLDDIIMKRQLTKIDSLADRTLAYLACRSAVQAGDPLTPDQAKRLYEKLIQTSNNATCPHGRPTRITLTIQQLEKMFHRR